MIAFKVAIGEKVYGKDESGRWWRLNDRGEIKHDVTDGYISLPEVLEVLNTLRSYPYINSKS